MKKVNLLLILILSTFSLTINAQGWIGNSNNLIAYNSLLGLTPIKVGIGVNSPTSLFHTNGTLRFQGLNQATGSTFNRLLITDNTGDVRWFDLNSLNQVDADWFDVSTNSAPTILTNDVYTESKVFILDQPIGTNVPRTNLHLLYTNTTPYSSNLLPIGEGLLIENRSNVLNSRASLIFMTRDNTTNFEATTAISSVATGTNQADIVFQNEVSGPVNMRESMRITSDGDVYLPTSNRGVILTSPNGNCWRLTVDNTGSPVYTSITCP